MSFYLRVSPETRRARKILEELEKQNGEKNLLKGFLDRERKQLAKQNGTMAVLNGIHCTNSAVHRFANFLEKEKNRRIFRQAIEAQAKSLGTKKGGLFYTLIWQSGNLNMEKLDLSKIKAFLLAKKGTNIGDDILGIGPDDKNSKRMKKHDILNKLNSSRLSHVLKIFIAFVLWEYSEILSQSNGADLTTVTDTTKKKQPENHQNSVPKKGCPEEDIEETKINEELKNQWRENRYNKNTGGKIGFDEMVMNANTQHARLKELHILSEGDNSRHSGSGGLFSTNYIKLFIRYLQRCFSELNGYVKIYYYPTMEDTKNHEKRKNQYWDRIKELVKESENGTTYLVFNQIVHKDEPQNGGHANLTFVCEGDYIVFETLRTRETAIMGSKDYRGNSIKMIPGSIQSDPQNCVSIALGYMESLMKQMSSWIKNETNEPDKKIFSKRIWNQVNGYSAVKLPDDIEGTDHSPLQVLLPPKYIRYIQTQKGRDKLIKLSETEKLGEKDQAMIWEVADELKKVRDKNNLSNIPLVRFLDDFSLFGDVENKKSKKFKKKVKSLAKAMNREPDDITYGDLRNLMDSKRLVTYDEHGLIWKTLSGQITRIPYVSYDEKLTEAVSKKSPEEKEAVKYELEHNPIYKAVSDNPIEMSYGNLYMEESLEVSGYGGFYKYAQNILRMNDPAQMRRRRNILKIATLVDVLEKRRKGSTKDEIGRVENLVTSTEES